MVEIPQKSPDDVERDHAILRRPGARVGDERAESRGRDGLDRSRMKIVGLYDVQLASHEAIIGLLECRRIRPCSSDRTITEMPFRETGGDLLQAHKIDHGVIVFVRKRIGRIRKKCLPPSQ